MEYNNNDILSVTYRDISPDVQFAVSFKKDLLDGYYAYDIDLVRNNVIALDLLLYGESGGSGYNSKRFTDIGQNT